MTPALVVLNPAARRGRGRERFRAVRPALDAAYQVRLIETSPAGCDADVIEALRDEVRVFLAAGGDGTVHALVNALVRHHGPVPLAELAVGAVGLGSSNDFHKPFGRTIAGIPVHIDLATARPHDLARARWDDGERVFVVSASLGVTAAANGRFDRPDRVLAALERHWVSGAIAYAAVGTIWTWRNVDAVIAIDGTPLRVPLTNLSVAKTPWLSGGLHYDTPIAPDDGRLLVNLCAGMTRRRTLRTLLALSRGHFQRLPGTRSWRVGAVQVSLDGEQDLELDGELYRAREVRFDVLPERVRLCG